MDFKNNDGCFWPTLRDLKLCLLAPFQVNQCMFEYTEDLRFCAVYVLQAATKSHW